MRTLIYRKVESNKTHIIKTEEFIFNTFDFNNIVGIVFHSVSDNSLSVIIEKDDNRNFTSPTTVYTATTIPYREWSDIIPVGTLPEDKFYRIRVTIPELTGMYKLELWGDVRMAGDIDSGGDSDTWHVLMSGLPLPVVEEGGNYYYLLDDGMTIAIPITFPDGVSEKQLKLKVADASPDVVNVTDSASNNYTLNPGDELVLTDNIDHITLQNPMDMMGSNPSYIEYFIVMYR